MSFTNETRYAALPVPLLDAQGNDVLVAIVKGTFTVDASGNLKLAPEQRPVRVADESYDPESPRSSLRHASDLCVEKRGTDVLVMGDAIAPRPVAQLDVATQVKERTVPLRVHGPRVFFDALLKVSIGPAQPFERVPITYELAYGGMSDDLTVIEARNPAGLGVARRAADLVGKRAPQIVHPERAHTSAGDRHPPVGFGPIMSHWSPRKEHAGTFDLRWQETRMPLLPVDYDARHANLAHPSLQFDEPLVPGDPLRVIGMSAAPFVLAVPPFTVVVRGRYDSGERVEVRAPIDTVLLHPEGRTVEVVARAALLVGRNARVLREVMVRSDG